VIVTSEDTMCIYCNYQEVSLQMLISPRNVIVRRLDVSPKVVKYLKNILRGCLVGHEI
jgi:hypothetical protein